MWESRRGRRLELSLLYLISIVLLPSPLPDSLSSENILSTTLASFCQARGRSCHWATSNKRGDLGSIRLFSRFKTCPPHLDLFLIPPLLEVSGVLSFCQSLT